jgi:hypothetical protein
MAPRSAVVVFVIALAVAASQVRLARRVSAGTRALGSCMRQAARLRALGWFRLAPLRSGVAHARRAGSAATCAGCGGGCGRVCGRTASVSSPRPTSRMRTPSRRMHGRVGAATACRTARAGARTGHLARGVHPATRGSVGRAPRGSGFWVPGATHALTRRAPQAAASDTSIASRRALLGARSEDGQSRNLQGCACPGGPSRAAGY